MGHKGSDSINVKLLVLIWPGRGKMDNLTNKTISNVDRTGSFSAVLLTMQDVVRRLIGFFKLTEEDRLKAGISLGCEGMMDKPVSTHSFPS